MIRIDVQIHDLKNRKNVMLEYLFLKIKEEDWHGCQDAASDLRDIEVELKTLMEIRPLLQQQLQQPQKDNA